MKKFLKFAGICLALIGTMILSGCADEDSNSSWNMHYFFTDYGRNSAMIRSPGNSDVAILATTEPGKGGDLYDSVFVTLTKTKSGDTYTFEGTKGGTSYKVVGKLAAVSNGTTNDSFTIQSSSDAMANLGFTSGKSIQHWTEQRSGAFIY